MPDPTPQQLYDLALQHHRAGRLQEAEALYRRVLAEQPDQPAAVYGLAGVAQRLGRMKEAIQLTERAIALNPNQGIYYATLGRMLQFESRWVDAAEAFRNCVTLQPDRAEVWEDLAHSLLQIGRPDLAQQAARKAMSLQPRPHASDYLVGALINLSEVQQAVEVAREGVARWPKDSTVHRTLGWACKEAGKLDEAIEAQRRGLVLAPHPQLYSDYLFTLHFQEGWDRNRIYQEHRRWYEACAAPLRGSILPHQNERSPDRRLRIGYVAHDLGNFPLGRFLLPLVTHHGRAHFEVFCYCDGFRPDPMGQQIRSKLDVERPTAGLGDEQLAALVRRDRIDILIDLSMHTNLNRLLMFARKPAPVQVTYLAYCSTTGLRTIDYRFTDKYLDPPGGDESCYAEKSVRLRSYWCYPVPPEAPDVGPLPALTNGTITFGCLNEYAKISPSALATWFSLLQRVRNSRLILHAKGGSHRQRVLDLAAREGIDSGRLEFVSYLPYADYFACYNRIDIALDPFPYAGGATTCDALWMGVPVVTLAQDIGVSRGGCSILSNIGLNELVTASREDYVQVAESLATRLPRLSEWRAGLRGRMQASPLMDAPGFARDVEAAYRQMWKQWCGLPLPVAGA